MTKEEEQFYSKKFNFSYSSLNKLLFLPSLFYKEYVLLEKEVKTEKHLIEGRLIHLLLLQPEKFNEQYVVVPSKMPSDSVIKVLIQVKNDSKVTEPCSLKKLDSFILKALIDQNLHQSLKEDSKRLEKVQTSDCQEYFDFLCTESKEIIDSALHERAKSAVEILKQNEEIMKLFFDNKTTDFELDNFESFNEQYLQADLKDYPFGLHGYIDRYVIDHNAKELIIVDFKTTNKTISDFAETVDFYKYWLQACIYVNLVLKNVDEKVKEYSINVKFVVIDKYDQVYVFPVSDESLAMWTQGLKQSLDTAKYHYDNKDFTLPYNFALGNVTL